ncbi:MAG TPA: NADH-quinone oxidoreductase subunit M [Roseiflexaceae bacterium]|nr:NADH-quinone oxidoreductase subunit M [Roseiflexaceae bacterium]
MSYLEFADGPWLTLLILSPLAGLLLLGLAAALRLDERTTKIGATLWSLTTLGLAIFVRADFDPGLVRDGQGVVQFVERVPWVEAIRVEYFLGVDGISLPLVLLTALMTPVAMLASWNVRERVYAHYALLFLLEAAMLGYFVALNFFFFFLFWEFSLVPAFFLIQNWGQNPERRRPAALTFFVYTMAGSLGLLLLFQVFYVATAAAGLPTFDLIILGRLGQGLPVEGVTANLQTILFDYLDLSGFTGLLGRFPLLYSSIAFWAIFVAFAIKLAVWPFHTWLPDAYSEAPTAGAILLSAVMSKMGAYGMLRILLPLVPEAAQYFAPVVGALALVGIVAGAFGALASVGGDARRLIAYTSINHMGYVALAIAAAAAFGPGASAQSRTIALNGAMMQLVAHGLSTGALFLLVGALAERTGTADLRRLGGLRSSMPTLAGAMGVALFANLGLPGLAGFVGEFLIFRGAWAALPLFTLLATVGLVITALALLQMYGRIFHGPADERLSRLPDLRIASREFLAAGPLLVLLLALGLYPAPLLDISNQAAAALAQVFERLLA